MLVNEKLYRGKIGKPPLPVYSLRMAKRRNRARSKLPPPNHIGEWMAKRGVKAVQVAKAAGIGESYLSLIVDNTKRNPGITILLAISECLQCSVNDLFRPPPEREAVGPVTKVTPDLLDALNMLKGALNSTDGDR